MISQQELKKLINYNPDTGTFSWIKSGIGYAAGEAGCRGEMYILIRVNKRLYKAQVLAWLYMTGKYAESKIDHINNNGFDNRWSNLRLATTSQNGANAKRSRANRTGYKGVGFHKASGKYVARITKDGKNIFIGRFSDPLTAYEAYCKKGKELFGEYFRSS